MQQSFAHRELALECGERMAKRGAAVLVYAVDVDPEIDAVSRPRLLARYGQRVSAARLAG
jgi:hypothetical protein